MMNRFSYFFVFSLVTVVLLVPASIQAQGGHTSATLNGSISETVALSVHPTLTPGDIDLDVVSSGSTVRITLFSSDAKSRVIRVALLVRSNSAFSISAIVESEMAEVSQLSVVDVQATGSLVSTAASSHLEVVPQFDGRESSESTFSTANPSPLDLSQPSLVFSGPRISLGGTLDSPWNALQITLLIRIMAGPTGGWVAHLTFSGTAKSGL